MREFVELWTYLSATPLFGLTATVVVYVLACAVYERLHQAPWANPVLWTVLILVSLLSLTQTAYPVYFSGAQFIHFLLGPAVVALAWPLWERRQLLRTHMRALLLAATFGGMVAAGSAWVLGVVLGLPSEVLLSLAPKSVTAPVAMGIAEQIGGIAALAAISAVLTGIVGAISGKYIFDALRIQPLAFSWLRFRNSFPWHRCRPRDASTSRCRRIRGFGFGAASYFGLDYFSTAHSHPGLIF